jgi:hypothetical protein
MNRMNLTTEQKEAVKSLIENDCVGFLREMDSYKNDLNEVSKTIQEQYDIKAADVKKMAKIAYLDSLEEEKGKSNEFFELFERIMGE